MENESSKIKGIFSVQSKVQGFTEKNIQKAAAGCVYSLFYDNTVPF